jgi:two-component system, NarL family, nitrate/nitrite response regulator NarL
MRSAHSRIRLLIADDERLFREGLKALLETNPRFQVIGYASDGADPVALARRLKPDVVLLGVATVEQQTLDMLRSLSAGPASIRTILITPSISRADVLTVLRHGARGIVTKNAAPDLLFKSIYAVVDGQYWIEREAVSDLVAAFREANPAGEPLPPRRRFNLTPRELEIVREVVGGQANREIAERLGVAEPTVKHHLTSIYDKLGVSNRLELALFAVHHHLV